MTVAAQDDLVLILSREMLEVADVAEFAAARALGNVVIEKNIETARSLVMEKRFAFAFVGVPSSDDRALLLNALSARRTLTVLIGSEAAHGSAHDSLRILPRPFTESDLDNAIARTTG